MCSSIEALNTDFYQITMAAAYHAHGMNGQATFSLFAHDLPPTRGYLVLAGLEQALDYLEEFRFTPEEIDYLRSLERFRPEFLEFLSQVRFTGEVWAPPEGTVLFAEQPLLEVTAPIIEAQLVETCLINILNLHSMLASKAARCVQAAGGRNCIDFSLRRTQGIDAGLAVARSSALVGFVGTSNVAAARRFGITPVGTMAHSFVEAFGDEMKAFEAFAATFPDNTVLLVDTYESVSGLHNAVALAKRLAEKGHQLVGVRLDSGDLAAMSRRARTLLDSAGLEQARVVVSGSLDELRIQKLLEQGAQVDSFGIGTRMGSSADAPYFDLAYKLVSYEGRPTLKLSSGKETWAGAKQIFRHYDDQGIITRDVLGLRDEEQEGRPLLEPVMRQGGRLGPRRDWRAAREVFQAEVATLPPACLELAHPVPLRTEISPRLRELQDDTRKAALKARVG